MRSDNINLLSNLTAEIAGAIKVILDQIPATLEANARRHGYLPGRKRYDQYD